MDIPRAYQLAIYNSIKEHGNTLVVLPTGLGKTLIAMMLIRDKIKEGRCLFLTPTKPLAKQHLDSVIKNLELSENVALVTGEVTPAKRKEQYLTDIIISTPQTIKNDLENGTLEPRFSLVVFDECVDPRTKIRLFNGSEVAIDKLSLLQGPIHVQSFNKETNRIEIAEVTAVHKIRSKKKFLELELEEGVLRCTEDHLILSANGEWKEAGQMKVSELVAFQPADIEFRTLGGRRKNIISMDKIMASYRNDNKLKKYYFHKIVKKLELNRLLPINYTNQSFLTLVRLFGYALGDGWLTEKNNQPCYLGFCGLKKDLERISADIISIGGSHSKLNSRITTSTLRHNNKQVIITGCSKSFLCTSAHIVRVISALGYPPSDKVNKRFSLPQWLLKSPPHIIKEFLGALMSADGHIPTPKKNARTFFVAKLTFYKDKRLIKNGLRYSKHLRQLFKKLGITTTLETTKGNTRKDGSETVKFNIVIGNSLSNQIRFLERILFLYSPEKEKKARYILEYLRAKKDALKTREMLWLRSNELHTRGWSARLISEELEIAEHTVESWIYMKREPKQTSIFFPTFEEWNSEEKLLPFGYTKVKSLKRIKKPRFVYDLTVNGTHNYIANGIIVHNCHRAVGEYAYTYVAEKLHKEGVLFVGLTASPGGRMDRIKEVMGALKIDNVEIRNHEDPDVSPYVQKSTVTWIEVELSEHFKEIKKELDFLTSKYAQRLGGMGFPPPLKHKGQFMQLRQRILNVESNIKYPALIQYSVLLHLLHMTELLETQGIYPLRSYVQKLREKESKSAKLLLNEEKIAKIEKMAEREEDHPKMLVLVETIKKLAGQKIIVFVQYRSQISRIEEVLKQTGVSARLFVGKKDGVTKKIQEETIAAFRNGEFDVLVASSIGEEGLDIPAVDTVIFYEPVPSEIRTIQRRGRAARLKEGQVIVLMTKGTRDEYYHYASKNREKKMKSILGGMQKAKKAGTKYESANQKPKRPGIGQSKMTDF